MDMGEYFSATQPPLNESARLSSIFQKMSTGERDGEQVFRELEDDLQAAGFSLGTTPEVFAVMQRPQLLCRSESFSRVLDLVSIHQDIVLENANDDANMCRMSSGAGFRVAMLEGFSGKDVEGMGANCNIFTRYCKVDLMSI